MRKQSESEFRVFSCDNYITKTKKNYKSFLKLTFKSFLKSESKFNSPLDMWTRPEGIEAKATGSAS